MERFDAFDIHFKHLQRERMAEAAGERLAAQLRGTRRPFRLAARDVGARLVAGVNRAASLLLSRDLALASPGADRVNVHMARRWLSLRPIDRGAFRWLARLAAGLLLLGSVVLPSSGALAEPVIDQVGKIAPWQCCSYLPIGNTAAGEESYGESITPTRTGQLTALWFAAVCNACADILSVQVAADNGNLGTWGPVLASTTIRETAWPAGVDLGGYMRIPLAPPLPVVAGQTYLVYLSHRTHEAASQFHVVWGGQLCCGGGRYVAISFAPAPNPYPYAPTPYGGTLAFESEIDPSLPAARVVNDTDPGLSYGGWGWFYNGGRPASIADIGNDVHATTNNGDWVSYTFTGTGISYISELSDGYGLVDVYLDGVKQATVDANAYGVHNLGDQVLFQHSWQAVGQHTLKLVKTSGVYMLLDALAVQP